MQSINSQTRIVICMPRRRRHSGKRRARSGRPRPGRELVKETILFQARFPEFTRGKKQLGRIRLGERWEHTSRVVKFVVSDKGLARRLCDTKVSARERDKGIVRYALGKANGNGQGAEAFLEGAIADVNRHFAGRHTSLDHLTALAKRKGLRGRNAEIYAEATWHLINSSKAFILSILSYCKKQVRQAD